MTIHNLGYYIDIIDAGSISVAARKNFIAQQSMSAYLKHLEEYFGVALIVREKPLRPTDEGQRLYEAAKEIDRLVVGFQNGLSVEEQALVIGLENSAAPAFLPDVIAELNSGLGRPLKIDVRPNNDGAARAETAELYIGAHPDLEQYNAVPLVEDHLALAVSETLLGACFGARAKTVRESLLATGSLALLKDVPFSVCEDVPKIETMLQNMNVIMKSNDYSLLNNMCVKGKSASIIWLDCAHREFAANEHILIVPLTDFRATTTLYIYYKKGRPLHSVARRFITTAKHYFAKSAKAMQ